MSNIDQPLNYSENSSFDLHTKSVHAQPNPQQPEKLTKQIRPRTPQINNLRTPIPILLQPRALKAVERVRDALAAAHDALVLVVAEGALVADAREGRGPHVAVADGAFAVAFVAEAADGDAGLFAAHYEVAGVVLVRLFLWFGGLEGWNLRMMARHVVMVWVELTQVNCYVLY